MANPLRLLSKLRRFPEDGDVAEYLKTENRQNFKAIEDAFRRIGNTSAALTSSIEETDSDLASVVQNSWTDLGAITLTATANPTKGTVVTDSIKFIRRGPNALIRIDFYQSAGSADGTGNYNIDISGIGTIDTAITGSYTGTTALTAATSSIVGVANFTNDGTFYDGNVFVASSTKVKLVSGRNNAIWGSGVSGLAGIVRLSAQFELPIVEFTS